MSRPVQSSVRSTSREEADPARRKIGLQMANTCSYNVPRRDRLRYVMRHTTFRFALDPTPEQARTLARYSGASRFAFNQSLQLVVDALAARRAGTSVTVPWSRFDLINAFNSWKTSESAGRVFVVAPDGTATKLVTGLSWRTQISAQVFEEAAVDLSRGLARYAQRSDRRIGFPRRSAKDAIRTASVFATRRIQPAVTQSASARFIPVRLRCRSSEPFGCTTTPGGCGGCFVPSCTSIRTPVKPSWDRVPESCQRRSPGELTDGTCA